MGGNWDFLAQTLRIQPTNMCLKVLLETKLVQKIDKHLYSSHRYGDFGDLVRASDFYEIDNKAIPTADSRSDSKIHTNSNSKSISSLLLT